MSNSDLNISAWLVGYGKQNHMTKEIRDNVHAEMRRAGINITPETYILFLQGMQEGWEEDIERSIEKSMWQLALTLEITHAEIRASLPNIFGGQA